MSKICLSPQDIRSPGAATGESIGDAFLADHHNCGERLSGDHVISLLFLRQITTEQDYNHWPKPSAFGIRQRHSLKVKVAMRRHNSALSPLDTEAEDCLQRCSPLKIHSPKALHPEQRLYLSRVSI